MRYQLPVMNNIVYRILPNPEYTQWFVARGMPQADLIKECFNETNNLKMIYPLYTDERFKEFHHWAATEGRGKYTMFMLSHPSYLLLRREDASSLQQMFQHEFHFISSAIGYSIYADYVFPFFGRNKLIVLLIISLMLFIKTRNFAFHLINVLLISTLIISCSNLLSRCTRNRPALLHDTDYDAESGDTSLHINIRLFHHLSLAKYKNQINQIFVIPPETINFIVSSEGVSSGVISSLETIKRFPEKL